VTDDVNGFCFLNHNNFDKDGNEAVSFEKLKVYVYICVCVAMHICMNAVARQITKF